MLQAKLLPALRPATKCEARVCKGNSGQTIASPAHARSAARKSSRQAYKEEHDKQADNDMITSRAVS